MVHRIQYETTECPHCGKKVRIELWNIVGGYRLVIKKVGGE